MSHWTWIICISIFFLFYIVIQLRQISTGLYILLQTIHSCYLLLSLWNLRNRNILVVHQLKVKTGTDTQNNYTQLQMKMKFVYKWRKIYFVLVGKYSCSKAIEKIPWFSLESLVYHILTWNISLVDFSYSVIWKINFYNNIQYFHQQ